MASLRETQRGNFIVCFRYQSQQYQRALKTKDPAAAKALKGRIEHTIYRLSAGEMTVPARVDIGDFIVWGEGALSRGNNEPVEECPVPTVEEVIQRYLKAHKGLKADSSLLTERCHLNNLTETLGPRAKLSLDGIHNHDLDGYLQRRLEQAERATVKKERQTIVSLFKWAVRQKLLQESPAVDLPTIQSAGNRAQFRTLAEIEQMVARGGLSDDEAEEIWGCLFLHAEGDRRNPGAGERSGRVRFRPSNGLHCRLHGDAARRNREPSALAGRQPRAIAP